MLFLGLDWLPTALAWIAGGLAIVAMQWVFTRISVRYFRRTPSALGKVNYHFSDDKIAISSETTQAELTWRALAKAKETPRYLFLYTGPITAFVIPLAQLATGQVEELRDLVQKQVRGR